jgi:hypothetical protein
MGSDEKRTITGSENQTLFCDKFISFGFDTEAMAVCGKMIYLKNGDGKYRMLEAYNDKKPG